MVIDNVCVARDHCGSPRLVAPREPGMDTRRWGGVRKHDAGPFWMGGETAREGGQARRE